MVIFLFFIINTRFYGEHLWVKQKHTNVKSKYSSYDVTKYKEYDKGRKEFENAIFLLAHKCPPFPILH